MTITIGITCRTCKVQHPIDIKYVDWLRYNQGHLIQSCFPYLSPSQRELIISKTCEKCWNELFKEDDEELASTMRVTLPTLEGSNEIAEFILLAETIHNVYGLVIEQGEGFTQNTVNYLQRMNKTN